MAPKKTTAVAKTVPKTSVLMAMAERYGMEAAAFEQTLRNTVIKEATKEQFAAFLVVAKEHNLNPLTKEIHAFPTKGGGIQPVVGIDGWMTIINNHPNADGMGFEDHHDENGKLVAITAKMYRKDRSHPTEVTEYMKECFRDKSEPWKKWPARMLRHKAAIQCARYAFGLSGIIDEDEYERGVGNMTDVTPPAPPPEEEEEKKKTSEATPVFDGKGERMEMPAEEAKIIDGVAEVIDAVMEDPDPAAEEIIAAATEPDAPPPPEEDFDPDKYLDDLEARACGIKDDDPNSFAELRDEYDEFRSKLFPPDANLADAIMSKHEARFVS